MADSPAAAEQPQPHFEIQKLYLRDVSLECPNTPAVFQDRQWQPEANLQLNTNAKPIGEDLREVVLTVTLTVKQSGQTAYLVEVQQAGLFTLRDIPADQVNPLMGIHCPTILFPFAREAIADLVQKAGFPQHLLPPVNFEALYAQQAQQQSEAEQPPTNATH
jgi:preprotein translocase subunit SecB